MKTKEELFVASNINGTENKGLIIIEGEKDPFMIAILTNNEKSVDYANGIAKKINCHDELVAALNEIIAYEDRGRAKGEPRIAEGLYNLAKNAIKTITA